MKTFALVVMFFSLIAGAGMLTTWVDAQSIDRGHRRPTPDTRTTSEGGTLFSSSMSTARPWLMVSCDVRDIGCRTPASKVTFESSYPDDSLVCANNGRVEKCITYHAFKVFLTVEP